MGKGPSRQRLVTTATPQRLSFAGGGTDIGDFYRLEGGAVISTAIRKYIYVTVKQHSPLFLEKYRLSYSQTEHVQSLDEIQNDIARECLRLVPVEPPLYISTIADLPAASGLGSSSSFAVGLLYALHILRGEDVSAGQLAEEACHVEIAVLKRPIGKQDQYAAAFGGLNHIVFHPDERVSLEPLWLGNTSLQALLDHSMLFWTGMQRDAGQILAEQKDNIGERIGELRMLRDLAERCRDLMLAPFAPNRFGALLDEGWKAKQRLSSRISNDRISEWYRKAMAAGAYGGKLAGAGGGGFLYLVVPPEHQDAVRGALNDMTEVSFEYEPRGARLLSLIEH